LENHGLQKSKGDDKMLAEQILNKLTISPLFRLEIPEKPKVYVTTMYRFGNRESHSYVLGVWSDKHYALEMGNVEELWRGGKYLPEVTEWTIDDNEFDRLPDDAHNSKRNVLENEEGTIE
jgi:hypothetical protein